MSEVGFAIADRQVGRARIDPNGVSGREQVGLRILCLPLELQLLPGGQKGDVKYTVLRLAGTLENQQIGGEFANFELGPLAEIPGANPYYRPQGVKITLDRQQIKRFEDSRAGNDAYFQIALSALVWYPAMQEFAKVESAGFLDVTVPKSVWVEKVVSPWNLSRIKIVEIEFPKTVVGDNFRSAYSKIEAAERFFSDGHSKQTLAELYAAFEGLAKSLKFALPDQNFFAELLSGQHPTKSRQFKLSLTSFCDLLHLGRHEPKEAVETFTVTRVDARFALTMAYAIFEYITSQP